MMQPYWVTFADGSGVCVNAASEEWAKAFVAVCLAGEVRTIKRLP